MPTVKFVNEKKSVDVPEGANLRTEARKAGIDINPGFHRYLNCMGNGTCASCRVYIKKGAENVSPQGFLEKLRLLLGPVTFWARLGHENDLRLSCQCKVEGDIEVETNPQANLYGEKFWD